MKKRLVALTFIAALGAFGSASAQSYPSRPVTIIVPFTAGGAFDTIGRIVADRLKVALGQPVIIENVAGAGGSIGVGRVARSLPDGYTLSLGIWSTHVINSAIYSLQYDPVKDFEPISLITSAPQVIVSRNTVPAKNLTELIAWLRANPDKATLATVGSGSPPHIAGLFFQQHTGTHIQYVPYRGAAPAVQDLLAGQVDLSILQAAAVLPQIKSGKIKAYAVTADTRLDSAPDIPTVDEAGVPGLYVSTWSALWAPKSTPKDVIGRLDAAIIETLADPAIRQRLVEIGQTIPPREQQTPEGLAAFQVAEIAKWWPIVKSANIK